MKRLYFDEPGCMESLATILEVVGKRVKLDRTIIFPGGGGQERDDAFIDGISIIGFSDGYYELKSPLKKGAGEIVSLYVDTLKRKKLSGMHTAQHLVALLFEKKTGIIQTSGSSVGVCKASTTYLTDENISTYLAEVEQEVNELIARDLPIVHAPDPNNPKMMLWKCGELSCHCGGTHVRRTGELSTISIKRKSGGKGKEKIEVFFL